MPNNYFIHPVFK